MSMRERVTVGLHAHRCVDVLHGDVGQRLIAKSVQGGESVENEHVGPREHLGEGEARAKLKHTKSLRRGADRESEACRGWERSSIPFFSFF